MSTRSPGNFHHGTERRRFGKRRQSGLTLVDLLISLAVSLLLIAGLLHVYLNAKNTYRAQESLARLMENGRVATELLARAVRRGGYWACSGTEPANLKNHLGTNQRGVHGTNGASNAPDTLRTLRADDDTGVAVLASFTLPAAITVASGHGLLANDLVVINDCRQGDIFDLSSVSATALTPGCSTCSESYGTSASVTKVSDSQFYIGTGAGGQPALFQNTDGTAQEMVEGVEDMQIFYGEDTDGDGDINRYVTPAAIDALCGVNPNCWTRVGAVRISLLLRTLDDNVALKPQTYLYNGSTVTATDKRLRRVFTTIVSLRNHRV